MIAAEVADRISAVILGATRCRGFALVLFYDYEGTEQEVDAIIAQADPKTAAGFLNGAASEFYKEAEQGLPARPV